MQLTYNAVDTGGRASSDSIEAGSIRDAVEQLRRRGLFVTNIAESASRNKAKDTAARIAVEAGSAKLPLKQLSHMTRQIAMLLRSGSGIVPAFMAIQRQTTRPAHNALLGKSLPTSKTASPYGCAEKTPAILRRRLLRHCCRGGSQRNAD
jgi:type II secretory pathway component PulF